MPPHEPPRPVRRLATDVEQETLRALGIIARELGNLNQRAELILDRLPERDRDSKTEFSIRPGHARLTFWNVNAWTVVAVVALIAFGVVAYVWVSQHQQHQGGTEQGANHRKMRSAEIGSDGSSRTSRETM